MKKIGFAIQLINQGRQDPIYINEESTWHNQLKDIRNYFRLLSGYDKTKTIKVLSFTEEGCFLTLFRPVGGRDEDLISGWIYIPNDIKISGAELYDCMNQVAAALGGSETQGIVNDLKPVFSKVYESAAVFKNKIQNSDKYAFRKVRTADWPRILELRFSPCYNDYKCIFLLDEQSGIEVAADSRHLMTDLTNKELMEYVILQSPSPEERRLKKIETLTINKMNFNGSCRLVKGTQVTIVASRKGFEDCVFKLQVSATMPLKLDGVVWKKLVSQDNFCIVNDKNEEITKQCTIKINGKFVDYSGITFTEEECRNLQYEVSMFGYETRRATVSAFSYDKFRIVLVREELCQEYKVYASNGERLSVSFKGKGLTRHGSPLKGYKKKGEWLQFDDLNIWKQRALGFVAALLLVGIVFGTMQFFGSKAKKTNNTEQAGKQDTTNKEVKTENDTKVDPHFIACVNYLNDSVWVKDSLDKYPDTKTLFDDLNQFKFNELNGKKYDKLAEQCQALKEIRQVSKGKVLKDPKTHKTYNKNAEDLKITHSAYCTWLRENTTNKVTNSSKVNGPAQSESSSSTGVSGSGANIK